MSARDDIAAHFTSDTLASQLLDAFAAEVIRKAANSAAVIHQNCHRQTCAGCEVRADILDVLRSVADVIGQDSRPADATPEPDFPECVHCGNQSGPLTPTGDRYPSGAQKFECADDCREKANPEPTGRDTELLRTVAATLRDESARQPERVLVNKGLHHAAQLVDRMANQASALGAEPTPTEVARLRTFANATDQRHRDIRARVAQVQLGVDGPEAWDLGTAILAILYGPPARMPKAAERRQLLLAAMQAEGGEWTTGLVKRTYRRLGLPHLYRGTVRADLAALVKSGDLAPHDSPGRRTYTLISRKDSV